MALTADIQAEMNAIVNRLVRPGEDVFDPEDAKRLKQLVVVDCQLGQMSTSALHLDFPSIFGSIQGYIAGFGSASISDDKKKSIRVGDTNKIFAGNWELRLLGHENDRTLWIYIDRKFDQTREVGDEEGYRLSFRSGEPSRLSKFGPLVLTIPISRGAKLNIGVGNLGFSYKTFKHPAPANG